MENLCLGFHLCSDSNTSAEAKMTSTKIEIVGNILNLISTYSNYVGALFEFTVIAFLITKILRNEVYFQSAYFVLYWIGLSVDFIAALIWFLNFACFQYQNRVLYFADNLSFWYSTLFVGFWNFVLAINRFTALLFPLKQARVSFFYGNCCTLQTPTTN